MMNYLGYLRKRNPAGTPRRTLSHFLNRDSDKKKSALASTFSDLFFAHPCRISSLPRGNGKNCAASPRLFFLFGCPIFPMLAHGVLWIVPRLRRSLPRRPRIAGASERRHNLPAGAKRADFFSPRIRGSDTRRRIPAHPFPQKKKKSVPLRLARPWAGTLLSARDFSARSRLRGRLFSCPT